MHRGHPRERLCGASRCGPVGRTGSAMRCLTRVSRSHNALGILKISYWRAAYWRKQPVIFCFMYACMYVEMNVKMNVTFACRMHVLKDVSASRMLFWNGDFLIAHVLQAKRLSLPKANWSPQARQALERWGVSPVATGDEGAALDLQAFEKA